ncbi:MAG: OmpH family outer membrane protein [Planctomycetaceae bacterium]|nr:OmpH family outer membrane protein [Planctomycetaceae bacterium]
MKRTLLSLLTLSMFALGLVASNVTAQTRPTTQPGTPTAGNQATNTPGVPAQPTPQQPTNPVAIVDIEYLMSVHPELDAKTRQLLAANQVKEKNFRTKQEKLQALSQELNGLATGTAPHMAKRDELMKSESDLKREAASAMEEVRIQSIKNQHKAFKDIQACIDSFAKKNNFLVVLNYVRPMTVLPPQQSSQFLATTPSEQALEIQLARQDNNTVLWYNPYYDITSVIEQMVNGLYPQLEKVDFAKRKLELFQRQGIGNSEMLAQPGIPARN